LRYKRKNKRNNYVKKKERNTFHSSSPNKPETTLIISSTTQISFSAPFITSPLGEHEFARGVEHVDADRARRGEFVEGEHNDRGESCAEVIFKGEAAMCSGVVRCGVDWPNIGVHEPDVAGVCIAVMILGVCVAEK
jgi:hypothetical protein